LIYADCNKLKLVRSGTSLRQVARSESKVARPGCKASSEQGVHRSGRTFRPRSTTSHKASQWQFPEPKHQKRKNLHGFSTRRKQDQCSILRESGRPMSAHTPACLQDGRWHNRAPEKPNQTGEFDPGSERTLAACLTHASRARTGFGLSKAANG
jgi:hypothetical protein